jgi:pyruvate dehydrogenase complex dehydrogenase (E1) component
MQDHFGESGEPNELLKHFGLDALHISMATHELLTKKRE